MTVPPEERSVESGDPADEPDHEEDDDDGSEESESEHVDGLTRPRVGHAAVDILGFRDRSEILFPPFARRFPGLRFNRDRHDAPAVTGRRI